MKRPPLREGFTTGTAAAAAAHAAVARLLGGKAPDTVAVALPPFLEQFNFENVELPCKDLPANPCHDNSAGKRNWTGDQKAALPRGGGAQGVPSQMGAGGLLPKELAAGFPMAEAARCREPSVAPAACTVKRQSQSGNAIEEVPALLPEAGPRLPVRIVANGMEPNNNAWAAVIKDGGDDPDATHGARIIVHAAKHPFPASAGVAHGPVSLAPGLLPPGQEPVHLYGGTGVGLVTLPGLPVAPGEPAINPEPRKQITFAALEAARHYGYSGPLHLLISVPEGAKRAQRTMNARLGITGGISILGTRGTVRPYSHEAWKATISQGISVASSLGLDTLLLSTGRRSERLGFGLYPELAPQCGIQVADFAAFALRGTAGYGFARIIWCCFPGKLLKLAQGLEWTHADSAAADIAMLARYCAEAGGSDALAAAVAALPTATGAFSLMARTPAIHDAVLRRVGSRAFAVLREWLACAGSCCPKLSLCVFSMQEALLLRLPQR